MTARPLSTTGCKALAMFKWPIISTLAPFVVHDEQLEGDVESQVVAARHLQSRCGLLVNIASALHPVVLKDGRVMFSSLEDQGFRSIWTGASGAFTPTAPGGLRS